MKNITEKFGNRTMDKKDVSGYLVNTLNDILKLDQSVSTKESVFDFGITSIQVTIFVERIHSRFKIPFSIETIYDHQTIDEIEKHIEEFTKSNYMVNKHKALKDNGEDII